MPDTVSARNAAKVRAGCCWECGHRLHTRPTLLERWQSCAECGRRFLLVSERLIIERMRVPADLVGRDLADVDMCVGVRSDELVRWDGTAIRSGLLPEDAWFEQAWFPPLAPA